MTNAQKTILIAEDDASLQSILKKSVAKRGYNVVVAENGRVAQQIFLVENVDLVLTDIRMPQGNGLELLHFIKRNKPVPVVPNDGFL